MNYECGAAVEKRLDAALETLGAGVGNEEVKLGVCPVPGLCKCHWALSTQFHPPGVLGLWTLNCAQDAIINTVFWFQRAATASGRGRRSRGLTTDATTT